MPLTTSLSMAHRLARPLTLVAALLIVLIPDSCSAPLPHPAKPSHRLCVSQLAFANQACAGMRFRQSMPNSLDEGTAFAPLPHLAPAGGIDQFSHRHEHGHSGGQRNGGQGHGNGHRHRHSRGAEECCEWLKAVDDMCVCSLLVRLPPALSKPNHSYKVEVEDECEVEWECDDD